MSCVCSVEDMEQQKKQDSDSGVGSDNGDKRLSATEVCVCVSLHLCVCVWGGILYICTNMTVTCSNIGVYSYVCVCIHAQICVRHVLNTLIFTPLILIF